MTKKIKDHRRHGDNHHKDQYQGDYDQDDQGDYDHYYDQGNYYQDDQGNYYQDDQGNYYYQDDQGNYYQGGYNQQENDKKVFGFLLFAIILGSGGTFVYWYLNRKTRFCKVDLNCSSEEVCRNGKCVPDTDGTKKDCLNCPPLHKCKDKKCVPFDCTTNAECEALGEDLTCTNGKCNTVYDSDNHLDWLWAILEILGIGLGCFFVIVLVSAFFPDVRQNLASLIVFLMILLVIATLAAGYILWQVSQLQIVLKETQLTDVNQNENKEVLENPGFVSNILQITNSEEKNQAQQYSLAGVVGGVVLLLCLFYFRTMIKENYRFLDEVRKDEEEYQKVIDDIKSTEKEDLAEKLLRIQELHASGRVAEAVLELKRLDSKNPLEKAADVAKNPVGSLLSLVNRVNPLAYSPEEILLQRSRLNIPYFQRIDLLSSEKVLDKIWARISQQTVPSLYTDDLTRSSIMRKDSKTKFNRKLMDLKNIFDAKQKKIQNEINDLEKSVGEVNQNGVLKYFKNLVYAPAEKKLQAKKDELELYQKLIAELGAPADR